MMKFGLHHPSYTEEVDEYSCDYTQRREKAEKKWSDSVFTNSTASEEHSKPPRQPKCSDDGGEPAAKRPYVKTNPQINTSSQSRRLETQKKVYKPRLSSSTASAIEKCPIDNCSKSYKGSAARNNLSRHIRTQHERAIKLKCPNCPREFIGRRDNLRQHFRNAHSEHEMPDWIAVKARGLTMREA